MAASSCSFTVTPPARPGWLLTSSVGEQVGAQGVLLLESDWSQELNLGSLVAASLVWMGPFSVSGLLVFLVARPGVPVPSQLPGSWWNFHHELSAPSDHPITPALP